MPGSKVRVEGDAVVVERLDDPDEEYIRTRLARQLRGDARRLHDELVTEGAPISWVQAIVVIWADFPQRIAEGHRIVFVHGDELVGWLEAQSRSLAADRLEAIATALEAPAGSPCATSLERKRSLRDRSRAWRR